MRRPIVITMVLFLLLAPLRFLNPVAHAQGWQWARAVTGGGNEGWSVATYGANDVYAGGMASAAASTLVFSPTVTLPVGYRSFWAHYDAGGNVLWAGGTSAGATKLYNLATDTAGNLIVFGVFTSTTMQVGPFTLTNTAAPGFQYYLAKINPAGTVLWAVNDGDLLWVPTSPVWGVHQDMGACATDTFGNIYVTSTFTKPIMTIGTYSLVNTNPSGTTADVFVAKYSPSGTLLWATSFGGIKDDCALAMTVAHDNAYVCGAFWSPSVSVGVSTISNTGTSPRAFIAEVSSAGMPLWADAAGGPHISFAAAIDADDAGNVYMTGGFSDNDISFGSTTISKAYPSTTSWMSAHFLVKYSAANVPLWGRSISSPAQLVTPFSVSAGSCGIVWVNAGFSQAVNISGIVVPLPPGYDDPGLIAGYNGSGGLVGYSTFTSGGDDIGGIAVDAKGFVYLCNDYIGNPPSVFVLGADTMTGDPGWEYQYLGRYSPGGAQCCAALVNITVAPNDTVCEGASVTFSAAVESTGSVVTYQWYVNGTVASTAGPGYSYTPANGDSVRCVVTVSGGDCLGSTVSSSNTINMVVVANPVVTITASPGDTVCPGTPVTFTVSPATGVTSPAYQWVVNGWNVGTGGTTYTYPPAAGDTIRCLLSGTAACGPLTMIRSNAIHITFVTATAPGIAIAANPGDTVCNWEPVTFDAITSWGGFAPVYDWKKNGVSVSSSSTYSYIPSNGDMVSCVFTSSYSCLTTSTAGSNTVTMVVNDCAGSVNELAEIEQVELTPNPTREEVTLSYSGKLQGGAQITIYDITGRQLIVCPLTGNRTIIDVATLPPGLYQCKIFINGSYSVLRKLVICCD